MNLLDVFILLVVAGGLALGVRSGLIKQIASIIGLVLAFILGVQLMRPVGAAVSQSLGVSESIAPLIGFGLVFLAIQIGVMLGVRAIEGLVGALKLTFVNRLLGGVFGAFKVTLVLSIVLLALIPLGVPGDDTRTTSELYEPVMKTLPGAWNFMSERFPEVQSLSEYFKRPLRESDEETEAPADSPTEAPEEAPAREPVETTTI